MRWTVPTARALSLAWALFWLSFFVVESLWFDTATYLLASWTGLGVVFVILAVTAWRTEFSGGILLVACGCLMGVAYILGAPPALPLLSRALTTFFLGVPPVLAGILFLRHQHN